MAVYPVPNDLAKKTAYVDYDATKITFVQDLKKAVEGAGYKVV